jgi:hypothetical protein
MMEETLGMAEFVLDTFLFFAVKAGKAISLWAEWAGGCLGKAIWMEVLWY